MMAQAYPVPAEPQVGQTPAPPSAPDEPMRGSSAGYSPRRSTRDAGDGYDSGQQTVTSGRANQTTRSSRAARSGDPGPVRTSDAPRRDVQAAYPRPFIPLHQLTPFDEISPRPERSDWRKGYQYTASAGRWTDGGKCTNLRMVLTPAVRAWLTQLGPDARSWTKLSATFEKEFTKPRGSFMAEYFALRQGQVENPRRYLCRLNATAQRAGVD